MAFEAFDFVGHYTGHLLHAVFAADTDIHDGALFGGNDAAVEALAGRGVLFTLLDIFDPGRVPNPAEIDFPAEDAMDGAPADAYLLDLYRVQIPALQADIDEALDKLDPKRDAAVIRELLDLRGDLESIRTQIGKYEDGEAEYWGVYAENQPLTGRGPITPDSAYKAVLNELSESRAVILGNRPINVIA